MVSKDATALPSNMSGGIFSARMLSPDVMTQSRAILARQRRIHLPGILKEHVAERIHAEMATLDWRLVLNGERGAYDLAPADIGALSTEKQAALLKTLHAGASEGFQYLFENYRISDLYESGEKRDGALAGLYATLNSPSGLAFLRAATGDSRIEYVDAQATRYRPGHFLTVHDDDVAGKDRLFAYVINLTPSWRADWGGLLMFVDGDGHVAEAYTPRWNALNILSVPQPHAVSYVAPFARGARYSITGWLRARRPADGE